MTINDSVTNEGVLDLGAASNDNILTIGSGGYTQTDLGYLYLQAGDAGDGSLIADSIITTGTATLDSLLQVFLDPGFELEPHQFYPLITADQIIGTFDTVLLPDPTSGPLYLELRLVYFDDMVMLSTKSVQPGDTDGDGDVDFDDRLAMENFYGATWEMIQANPEYAAGDTDGDLDVDFDDRLAVENFYGTPPPGLASGAVPEPASLALLTLGTLALLKRHRI